MPQIFKPKHRTITAVLRREDGGWDVTLDCGHVSDGVAHMDFSGSIGRHHICCPCSYVEA